MKKVLTIGSGIVDIYLTSSEFEMPDEGKICVGVVGGKMDIQNFDIQTGGGATNTAVAFSKLGFDSAAISELGKDLLAELVVKDLKKYGVSDELLIHEKKEETGGSVILTAKNGKRMALVHRGASSMLDPKDLDFKEVGGKFGRPEWIHVSNLSGRQDTLKHLFGMAASNNYQLSWNPGSSDLELIADGKLGIHDLFVKILFVNREEWDLVSSKQADLLKKIELVVITSGENGGSIFQNAQHVLDYEALRVEAVNTIGAGDAFCAGFVAAHLYDKDLKTAAHWGAKNAASVVKEVGAKAGLLTLGEINS